MLENPNEKIDLKFKIKFGNLKKDFKENYYLATQEKAYENKVADCIMICEKDNTKYAIIKENFLGTPMTKYINLKCFEEYHCRNKDISA